MHDPICALISTYKDGTMVQGTIKSLHRAGIDNIIVCEGAWAKDAPDGPATDLGVYKRYRLDTRTLFENEADKRNHMLKAARVRMKGKPFWIFTIDADEILVWGEYLSDWLNVLKPPQEAIVPIKITIPGAGWQDITQDMRVTEFDSDEEIEWRNSLYERISAFHTVTYFAPSHLVHSTLIHHYNLGILEAVTTEGKMVNFATIRSPTEPFQGEPHLHHRYYLRRGERFKFRGSELEAEELRKRGNNRS